jgi:flagellar hook-associated protein 1 FlgK
VVTTLASASQTVTTVRNQADGAMADSVARLNDLLGQLTLSNNAAVSMTLAGEDATDALDKRDSILTEISGEIGITVVQRDHGDVAVYTDGGVTLFDKSPRTVTFTPTASLPPGVAGNPLMIDGMPVTGANPTMPIHAGALAGLAALRDEVAPTCQAQLDEMARGLIASFNESDQSGGGGPDLAGLFTWSGGPGLPAAGTLSSGLALSLKVNPAVDPAQGGNLDRIRDGGINGTNYRYNPTSAASFPARIDGLVTAMNADRAFDPAAGVTNSASLVNFSTSSVSWLEDQRRAAGSAADYQSALLSRATEALSNATGVNIDAEYTIQLQLEQSYQAAAKMITLINSMMQTLLDSLR